MRNTRIRNESSTMEIVPGLYQHYKGGKYEVLGVARFSEDPHQEFVVYKALYESKLEPDGIVLPSGSLWIRPKEMFAESIVIDGKSIARFRKI